MENNNSKKVLFSIIGVAILIVAVVGVSFAFFTYSRTGSTNNVITTGKITFNFDNEQAPSGKIKPDGSVEMNTPLILGNATPKAAPDADDGEYGFSVQGQLPSNVTATPFEIYVVEGDLPGATEVGGATTMKHPAAAKSSDGTVETEEERTVYTEADRLDFGYISIKVSADTTNSSADAQDGLDDTIIATYKTGAALEKKPGKDGRDGVLIAKGTIGNDNKDYKYAYKLAMWVNQTATVSDTDANAKFRASRTTTEVLPSSQEEDTRKVYSDMFYSLKIRVVAGDETLGN